VLPEPEAIAPLAEPLTPPAVDPDPEPDPAVDPEAASKPLEPVEPLASDGYSGLEVLQAAKGAARALPTVTKLNQIRMEGTLPDYWGDSAIFMMSQRLVVQ